jgi:hypothetical protein
MPLHHVRHADLEAGLAEIERSPRERGSLEMIVRRPRAGEREVLDSATLDVEHGLRGDRWALGKRRLTNQLTLINTRFVTLLAQSPDRWPLAGDQLYVDFDLSVAHVPPGSRLRVGAAEIEVSPEPHLGCRLFRERYGEDALEFVNSELGRALQLRGINAWVVKGGQVRVGDDVCALFG